MKFLDVIVSHSWYSVLLTKALANGVINKSNSRHFFFFDDSSHSLMTLKSPFNRVDGALRALVLEFSLGSSMYATMAIREVLKAPTDVHYQV